MRKKLVLVVLVSVSIFMHTGISQTKPGFFLDDWKEKTIENPVGISVPQSVKAHDISVSVNAADTIHRVSKYMFGGNLNVYSPLFSKHPQYIDDLQNLSPNVLRWPGGNGSNEYFWNASQSTLPADLPPHDKLGTSTQGSYWVGQKPGTSVSLDEYYDLMKTTNATGTICVNYSYARYGLSENPVAVAAKLAADWVRYDNGRTKFWEIGNENYGNWQTGYVIDTSLYTDDRPVKISGKLYGQHCRVFIDSMRKAAAEIGVEIYIGVQGWESFTSWDPVQTEWNDGVFSEVGGIADFVVVHSYYTEYNQNSTIEQIFATRKLTYEFPHVIETKLKENGHGPLPIALTEYNTRAKSDGQLISIINGMHAIMVLGDAMKLGYGMANRWSTIGYWSAPGEMGTFSYAGQPGVPEGDMRPDFYYLYFFQKLFGDKMVSSTSTDTADVFSFASTYSSGQCGVVLFNKTNEEKTIKVGLNNFKKGAKYHYYVLTGGTDNAPFSGRVYINGFGTQYEKGGPAETYDIIKPYSTTISGDILVDAPAYSVIFMVVEGEDRPVFESAVVKESEKTKLELNLSMGITLPVSNSGFSILANGAEKINITNVARSASDTSILVLTLGREIVNADELVISYKNGAIVSNGFTLVPFENKPVENLLIGSSPVVVSAKTIDNKSIEVAFNKKMMATVKTGFGIEATNPKYVFEIDLARFANTDSLAFVLVLKESISFDDKLILKYSEDTIKSSDNGILKPFELEIENLIQPVAIKLDSAYTGEKADRILLFYDQMLAGAVNQESFFTITVDGETIKPVLVAPGNNILNIYVAEAFLPGQEITLNYSGGAIKSIYGLSIPDIVNLEIKNNAIKTPKYIKNVKVNGSTTGFQIDIARTGVLCYMDRAYVFGQLPDSINFSEFIRWNMGLKSTPAKVLLSFTIDTSGIVYVAHDNRLQKPDWLKDNFTKSEISFAFAQTDSATLYYKEYLEGSKIELGANQIAGTETGTSFNYVVFFAENYVEDTTTPPVLLKEISFGDLLVYPNPANKIVNVRLPEVNTQSVSIYDITGKLVFSQYFHGNMLEINTSEFESGIYKIISVSDENVFESSFIVQ